MKNYRCKKCEKLVQSERSPEASGCLKGSLHAWVDMGEIGNDTYQCKKCGLVLKNKKMPPMPGCNGGSFHQWAKLNR